VPADRQAPQRVPGALGGGSRTPQRA
jgi:hypothetical protein